MTETKKKTNVARELAVVFFVLLLLITFTAASSELLTPKRYDYGATWGQYLEEPENSLDVLFFGSSITYCDVVPAVIWEKSGVASYVMAGPEQTVPISYYYIREACKTQSPQAVFLEVTGVFFERYQNFTKVNVGYMPYGSNRLGAAFHASEREELTGLLFPLYNYHSRFDRLTQEDFAIALWGYGQDDFAGYTFLDTAAEIDSVQPRGETLDEENYARNIEYLRKIAEFCRQEDIKPVFYIAPTCLSLSDEHLSMLKSDIEAIDGVSFIDFNSDEYSTDYDLQRDYYDLLHFNCYGAEKFSAQLGKLMTGTLGIRADSGSDDALWLQRLESFNARVQASSASAQSAS